MSISAISLDTESPVLFQSGAPGARISMQVEVDTWEDFNDGAWIERTIDGSPLEF